MYIKKNDNEHSVILPLEMALLVFLPLLLIAVSSGLADDYGAQLDRKSFPSGFIFGTASSAYQYEGGTRDDGKGLSNWDKYTHSHPERILDRSNGDVAVDQYHHYKEDVKLMKDMFLDAYRFSISWSRLLPNGSMSGGINRKGVDYYNNLINELLSKGLQPFVTLFHWDSPEALEEQYGGFLSPNIVEDFRDYAEVCFREFGDRVKHWITFNEPHVYSVLGFAYGLTAPGRCSSWEIGKCKVGDSGREPYAVGHHQLLAHAAAVNLYRSRFQKIQKGKIGISLNCDWVVPYSNSKSNGDAVERALDFVLGWFMDPLTEGDYPFNMRALVGDRLPKFTEEQSKLLRGSFDFIGLNYYTANYVESFPIVNQVNISYNTDSYTIYTPERNGIPIGPKHGSKRIYVYPQGVYDLLLYTKSKYNDPVIYITENGIDQQDNETLSLEEALKDDIRTDYFRQHLHNVQKAISIVSSGLADDYEAQLDRKSFPEGFVFGTASSAYQYEGGAREDGKGLSSWDKYTHSHPERILDGSNGDVAVNQYHRYKEDVNIMKDMGLDAYRFSISWSRILPNGSLSGGINKKGVNYYNNLIDELLSKGLQPFVTLFHWDSPYGLEEQYGGFLSPHIVEDFRDYVEVCFREFGDRVKHWITFNEPHIYSVLGYASGLLAPGRCSSWELGKCKVGDSGREPYAVGHHQLLAHAAAVKMYRRQFQKIQKGKIGITLDCNWVVPYSKSKSNGDAVNRAVDFVLGWFMDPLTNGDYPFNMRALVGDRLPKFTEQQSKLVKGSFDFIGLNYYTANFVDSLPYVNQVNISYNTDSYTYQTSERNGMPIGPKPGSTWIYVYPQGIHDLLLYTKSKYNNPVIYVTENGIDQKDNGTLSLAEALKDDARIEYYKQHLLNVRKAIREGVDVRGYFAWSLLDNFEWSAGYNVRFGLHYVDYEDDLKRYPKSSALWFQKFLQK